MAKKLNQQLALDAIELCGDCQQRLCYTEVLEQYKELMSDGAIFPPVEVIWDGKHNWLWDGFHRVRAKRELGEKTILANIEIGNKEQAIWLSYSANKTHGIQRGKGTVKFILQRIFQEQKHAKKTDAEIAAHVGCHRSFVQRIRAEVLGEKSPEPTPKLQAKTPPRKNGPRGLEKLKDCTGQEIPSDVLADRFLSRVVVSRRIMDLDAIKNGIVNSVGNGDLTWALLNQNGFLADYQLVRARLEAALPYALCPYCGGGRGKGCEACRRFGFVNETTYKNAPKKENKK